MKKPIFLSTILLSLMFVSGSCTSDEPAIQNNQPENLYSKTKQRTLNEITAFAQNAYTDNYTTLKYISVSK